MPTEKMKLSYLIDLIKRLHDPDDEMPKVIDHLIDDLLKLDLLDLEKIEIDKTDIYKK